MNITKYWQLPTERQNEVIREATPPPVRSWAKITPSDCKCKVADTAKCWEQQHGYRPGDCSCSCHYECGGDF